MNRRGAGFGFCAIAILLFTVNYLAALIWMPNVTSWPSATGRFAEAYSQVGWTLTELAIGLICVGVGYMVRAELDGRS